MRQEAWDALADMAPALVERRPNVGVRVRVIAGKELGAEGVVTWHGRDRFDRSSRYLDDMGRQFVDIRGTRGFRVRVTTDDGEQFFIGADKVCVL